MEVVANESGTPRPTEHERAPTHAAYSDEAQYNFGRYRGLGLVTLPIAEVTPLSDELRGLLAESGMSELKWEKIRSGRGRLAAAKLLTWVVERALAGRLRIDTLTWDVEENPQRGHEGYIGRHVRRLQQMYAYLLTTTLTRRWQPAKSERSEAPYWRVYPDEQDALDWPALAASAPHIERINPSVSHEEPLIQLADVFVGLAVFSRASFDVYERWLADTSAGADEPESEDGAPDRISGSLRQRLLILDAWYTLAKARSLGVSLRSQRGLKTYQSDAPITFAWYSPNAQC